MSDLNFLEKQKLERLLGMGSGYVLDFTDRTFREFVSDCTGKDIDAEEYGQLSKAKRLRAFWIKEPNHVVARLLEGLFNYCADNGCSPGADDSVLAEQCKTILERLKERAPVHDLDAIKPNTSDRDFDILAKTVKEAIDKNEPSQGLDRLHTFVVRYLRELCKQRGVAFDRDTTLHSLMGAYVKPLRQNHLIESEITERILKYSISVLDAFNDVRNNKSLAHANPVLNYRESILIYNNVCSLIHFLNSLEGDRLRMCDHVEIELNLNDRDIPF